MAGTPLSRTPVPGGVGTAAGDQPGSGGSIARVLPASAGGCVPGPRGVGELGERRAGPPPPQPVGALHPVPDSEPREGHSFRLGQGPSAPPELRPGIEGAADLGGPSPPPPWGGCAPSGSLRRCPAQIWGGPSLSRWWVSQLRVGGVRLCCCAWEQSPAPDLTRASVELGLWLRSCVVSRRSSASWGGVLVRVGRKCVCMEGWWCR